ncbi:MAG: FAD-dependent oxidoreductase [Actinobacteria bacterium]|nr:FAD-dependent oxidoreductase [Actinomycetota bacterium]
MTIGFDIVVVGAGPAGSLAALTAARAGVTVALIERGPYPGSKNVYGGVLYARILDSVIPDWPERAPIQRWVTRRSTMVLTEHGSVAMDVRGDAWSQEPHNGVTAFRSEFDSWLADEAVDAGATLIPSTTAIGLLYDGGTVVGVRTDRPEGDIGARVVIACDGVNSLLAREAGLYDGFDASNFTLGVKEVIGFDKAEIDKRFGVRGREGVDIETLGGTSGVSGGGFVYTNLESVAVGVVLSLAGLRAAALRPEEILRRFKTHPSIAPLVEGGELLEYSAHLIPEGGLDAMPELVTDGMMVTGDAAGMCLAAGVFLEGVNFAMATGIAAGETAAEAISAGDVSRTGLGGYRRRLDGSFVLPDHRRFQRIPRLLLSERVQERYSRFVVDTATELFTVRNTAPKVGLWRIMGAARRRYGVRWRDVIRDGFTLIRGFK